MITILTSVAWINLRGRGTEGEGGRTEGEGGSRILSVSLFIVLPFVSTAYLEQRSIPAGGRLRPREGPASMKQKP